MLFVNLLSAESKIPSILEIHYFCMKWHDNIAN